jgi:3-deoxy-7-phosphoheptulonate synthase
MIVVMRRDATEEDVQHMIKQVEALGLKPTLLRGTERNVIAAIGDERAAAGVGVLESGRGVDEVLPVLAPYKIASLETKSEPTVVRAGSLTVGGGQLGVIAGPCSVENEEQIVGTARAIKSAGATALRGGAF